MTIGHVDVVSVPVKDQDAAKRFFVDTLGFEEVADNPMGPDQRWVQVRPAGGQASLTLVTWFDSMPAGSLSGLVFSVDDAQRAYRELRAKGVEFTMKPETQPWGTQAVFQDPDGNSFVLMQPAG
jgi:catechol 2,3-dioxygenase-like lactoylglutathione lyase family enzyme